jgi:hypothetical protein
VTFWAVTTPAVLSIVIVPLSCEVSAKVPVTLKTIVAAWAEASASRPANNTGTMFLRRINEPFTPQVLDLGATRRFIPKELESTAMSEHLLDFGWLSPKTHLHRPFGLKRSRTSDGQRVSRPGPQVNRLF